jgi:hypothetical protein
MKMANKKIIKKTNKKNSRRKARDAFPCVGEFCGMLRGSASELSYPDLAAQRPGVKGKIETQFTLVTDANGSAAFTLAPSVLNAHLYRAATIVSDVVTSWGTASSPAIYGSIAGAFDTMRVIAATVQVDYIHSNSQNQGLLALMSGSDASWPSLTDQPVSYADYAARRNLGRMSEGGYMVALPEGPSAYDWDKTETSGATSGANTKLTQLFGFVTGAQPSVSIANVTVIQYVQLQPDGDGWLNVLSKPVPPADDAYVEAWNRMYYVLTTTGASIGIKTLNLLADQFPNLAREAGRAFFQHVRSTATRRLENY